MTQLIPKHYSHTLPGGDPNFFRLERDGLTQGALMRWMLCPEKCRLSLLNGLGMAYRKDAIEFGNIVHFNLELVYGWYGDNIAMHRTVSMQEILGFSEHMLRKQEMIAYGQVMSDADNKAMQSNYRVAAEILALYYQRYPGDFLTKEWVMLEKELATPYNTTIDGIDCTFPLRGKVDGLLRQSRGSKGLWLFDTKTKGSIDEPSIVPRLGYDFQMGFYMYLIKMIYNEQVDGLIYSLIKRPGLRQKVSETVDEYAKRCGLDAYNAPDDYFKRIECIWTPIDTVRFEEEMHTVINSFVRWYIHGEPNYRNSANCHNGLWKCEFIPTCSAGDIDTLKINDRPYPELVASLPQME